jgi:hypothetical protein
MENNFQKVQKSADMKDSREFYSLAGKAPGLAEKDWYKFKNKGRTCRNPNWWQIFVGGVILYFPSQACLHPARLQETNEWHSARRVANLIPVPLAYQAYDNLKDSSQ